MLLPENRVVMISGANRGIGLAIAKRLSQAGYRLSLGARDTSQINRDDFASDISVHQYEATDRKAASAWVSATLDQMGGIDALVLNAGVLKPVGIEEVDEDSLDLMWEVNFKAPLRLTSAALPALKRCKNGRVINLVSLSGKRVMSGGNLGYCASKYAALSLTHAIRQDGWSDGIRATAICPGLVDTDMVSTVKTPDGEFKITPEAIAETAAYALSLPADASVAEILVNSRAESMF